MSKTVKPRVLIRFILLFAWEIITDLARRLKKRFFCKRRKIVVEPSRWRFWVRLVLMAVGIGVGLTALPFS